MIQLNVGEIFISLLLNFLELIMLGLGKIYALKYLLYLYFHFILDFVLQRFLKAPKEQKGPLW